MFRVKIRAWSTGSAQGFRFPACGADEAGKLEQGSQGNSKYVTDFKGGCMGLKRRDLIKGAAAVPLALTLRPGGALARSSSVVCLSRDAQRAAGIPQPAPIAQADVDDWMRGQISLCQVSTNNGKDWSTQRYFVGVDKTSLWQISTTSTGETATKHATYNVGNVMVKMTGEKRHALMYVDSQGNGITGYAMEKNGGNATTGSCWTSVKAV